MFTKYSPRIPIIMYHRVLDEKDTGLPDGYTKANSVTHISKFLEQIHLFKKRYTIINLNDAIEYLQKRKRYKKCPCVITFDDGYIDHYKNVFPILQRNNVPATFFIIGDCIAGTKKIRWLDKYYYILHNAKLKYGNNKLNERIDHFCGYYDKKDSKKLSPETLKIYLRFSLEKDNILDDLGNFLKITLNIEELNQNLYISKKHISEMLGQKITFGAHTMSHYDLHHIPIKDVDQEIINSGRMVRKITKEKIIPFAYPFGGKTTYNKKIINILKDNNFSCACTSVPGFNTTSTSQFELKRFDANKLDIKGILD